MCFFEKPAEATWPCWYYMSKYVSKITQGGNVMILPERCGELAHAWGLWAFHSSMLFHFVLALPVAQRHPFGQVPSSRCCFRSASGLDIGFERRLAAVWGKCRSAAWNPLCLHFHHSRHPAGLLRGIGSHFVAVEYRADPGNRCSGSLGRIESYSVAVAVRAVPGSRFFDHQVGIQLGRIRSGPRCHIGSCLADPVDHIGRRVFAGHTLGILGRVLVGRTLGIPGTVLVGHSFPVGRRTAADRRTETYCLFR